MGERGTRSWCGGTIGGVVGGGAWLGVFEVEATEERGAWGSWFDDVVAARAWRMNSLLYAMSRPRGDLYGS